MTRQRRSIAQTVGIPILIAAVVVGLGFGQTATIEGQVQTYTCAAPGGFAGEAVVPVAPILLTSLKTIANPVLPTDPLTGAVVLRGDLVDYVANLQAAIRLGKAFFWDMQVGSDNQTACATCHFNAGGDIRDRNQLSPGPNGSWDQVYYAPNSTLFPGGFPFTISDAKPLPNPTVPYPDANAPSAPKIFDTDNIVGSQGVRKSTFSGIDAKGNELTIPVADATFSVGGKNVRQVTGKNAPPVINAVFNHRNFFNSRAQPEFNGVNPFGQRDLSARVWVVNSLGGATSTNIVIKNASLASQAVGPVLNDVEMSAAGRTFPDVARKLLLRKPLGLQQVSAADSVLGPLADSPKGLTTSYAALIQKAFTPKWWNSTAQVQVGTKLMSMTEANFSLFWGLSVMLYEATLVSDDSPLDRFLMYRSVPGGVPNPTLLDPVVARVGGSVTHDNIINGLTLFEMPPPPAPGPNGVGCMLCHGGAELTNASVRALTAGVEPLDQNFKKFGFDLRMERMFMQIPPVAPNMNQVALDTATYQMTATNTTTGATAPVRIATYDTGFYNVGVRPTADDPGLDATDPWGKFLSFTRFLQTTQLNPSFIKVPGNGLACGGAIVNNTSGFPLLSGGLKKTEATDTAGSFKVLALRNTELNGPYFHNGGKATLAQVLDFYSIGGDFSNATLAPLIRPLIDPLTGAPLKAEQKNDLLMMLLSLTDERVLKEQAPFDHPELSVPNGDNPPGVDNLMTRPAVGAAGGADIPRFLSLSPFVR
jgi:cytochrome c peroxidase